MPILYANYKGLNTREQPPFALEIISKGDKSGLKRLIKNTLERRSKEIK
jgi:hypothetical protein